MAISRFFHVSLCVSDLARSLEFYRDVLGFAVTGRAVFEGEAISRLLALGECRLRAAFLARDGIRLELACFERPVGGPPSPPPRPNQIGLSHLTFAVDDLVVTLQSLRDRGVEVLGETRCELGPGVSACMMRDPDGLLIELYQHPVGVASPYEPAIGAGGGEVDAPDRS